jgi:hypothetical protein
MADGITRANLAERTERFLRRGRPWQPDVLLVRGDTGARVVKDYRPRPALYRIGVGLFSVWQEARMYRRLQGLDGIARCFGTLDRWALAIEYIDGRSAAICRPGDLPPAFFRRLDEIVAGVHARGVVLADLRNRKNVLVTPDHRPYLIDLVTAFERGRAWNLPRNLLHRVFRQDDLLGVIKLKRRLAPELVTPEEAARLDRGLFLQKPAMAARDFVVRWLKRLVAQPGK